LVLGHIHRDHNLECNDLHLDLSRVHDHDYGDLSVSVKGRDILVNRKKVVFCCIDDLQAYIPRSVLGIKAHSVRLMSYLLGAMGYALISFFFRNLLNSFCLCPHHVLT
jgi:hypothetical protein